MTRPALHSLVVLPMFRSLVIAVTLTGMALCQHRCMTVCGGRAGASAAAVAGCPCCEHRDGPTNDGCPEQPCRPGQGGECDCQGICGGALTGEAPILDGLFQAWAAAAVFVAVPRDFTPVLSRDLRYARGEPAAPGAPDGRALRILIASLLT